MLIRLLSLVGVAAVVMVVLAAGLVAIWLLLALHYLLEAYTPLLLALVVLLLHFMVKALTVLILQ
jgi:hypothetical protein